MLNHDLLLQLTGKAPRLTPGELWGALPGEFRISALQAAMDPGSNKDLRAQVAHLLARKLHGYRLQTILQWGRPRIAEEAVRQNIQDEIVVQSALIHYFLHDRMAIQIAFFDLLGFDHADGELKQDLPVPAAPPAKLHGAAQQLLKKPGGDDALLYLLCLAILMPAEWDSLGGWLEKYAAGAK